MNKRKFKRLAVKSLGIKPEKEEKRMSECEIITILQELFNGVKRSSLVSLTLSEEHQVEMWLDNKLSEASAQEVSEMKRGRKELCVEEEE